MITEYDKAKKLGDRQVHRAIVSGQYPYLPALDDLLETGHAEYPVGLAEIPVRMIAGTKTQGRQSAFSSGFMPILDNSSEFAAKWNQLYNAQLEEGIRDPVKVYEYMQRFYVQEGNKRVSVMRYLDMPLIMADVIRVMPFRRDERDIRVYYEFTEFYRVAPIYEITFTEEGCYADLAEILGQDLSEPWPAETVEAVRSAFSLFSKLFEPRRGYLEITTGDAFLLYLKIYSIESILNESSSVIEKRISGIWNEILNASRTGSDRINLIERPEVLDSPPPAGASAGGVLRSLLKAAPKYTEENPLRIAFLYEKAPDESRWIYSHELGRNHLEQVFDGLVETIRYDGCSTDEQIGKAVESAAADKNELVITTSPAQMNQTLRSAIAFPEIKFMNCSVNLAHSAVRSYYGRMFEAKFLMGALAASASDNALISYRADYPIYGAIANINAFAIGAAMVNPDARILLSWSSVKKHDEWQEDMLEKEVTVFSGPDLIKPRTASREYGIYRRESGGTIRNLAAPVWDWGVFYEKIVRTVLNGTWEARAMTKDGQAVNYWLGMDSGVIDVILSDKIPYYSRKLVKTLKQAVCAGSLSPFDGELRSREGVVKAEDAPRLTNEEIITMNWLNDNVIGTIPDLSDLYEEAKETVQVSGVKPPEKNPGAV